jgi:ADP-ribose pyrophosphatase YjhB (NUDIX family)
MEDNMQGSALFKIRATGILIIDNEILIVKQKVNSNRNWSLPGGRIEGKETIKDGLERELLEETGLEVKCKKLLYLCEKNNFEERYLHITFLVEKMGGEIKLPTNEFDKNPISEVKFIKCNKLIEYGFSEKFQGLVLDGFKNAGNYMGDKINIGL